ncbi:hypothetical protein CBS101457_000009 [Exobasidium rhododendri]|nr:hypothetical protein CBS101457_000009 [Exobasidium rhododendri]
MTSDLTVALRCYSARDRAEFDGDDFLKKGFRHAAGLFTSRRDGEVVDGIRVLQREHERDGRDLLRDRPWMRRKESKRSFPVDGSEKIFWIPEALHIFVWEELLVGKKDPSSVHVRIGPIRLSRYSDAILEERGDAGRDTVASGLNDEVGLQGSSHDEQ